MQPTKEGPPNGEEERRETPFFEPCEMCRGKKKTTGSLVFNCVVDRDRKIEREKNSAQKRKKGGMKKGVEKTFESR